MHCLVYNLGSGKASREAGASGWLTEAVELRAVRAGGNRNRDSVRKG